MEEKQEKTLVFFKETKAPWTFKELETILPKKKGIVPLSIKDVLECLVSDNLVKKEKIGTSVLFWAFPSDVEQTKKNQIQKLTVELKGFEEEILKVKDIIAEEEKERIDSEERKQKLEEYLRLFEENDKNNLELGILRNLDPIKFEENKKRMENAKIGINQWTDNLFILLSYCRNNFGIENKQLLSLADLSPDIDYV